MSQSLSRTKTQVLEKAFCNDWQWFVTLTLDQTKYQRDNLGVFIKDLGEFIRYQRKKRGIEIQYLLIPELHADGKNWHMHGLLSALPPEDMEPHPLAKLAMQGYQNWKPYANKFGFCSVGSIRDPAKCALYVTKYITKNLKDSPVALNKKLYYCSRGLKVAERVHEGILNRPINFEMAFKGLYSASTYVTSIEWFESYFEEIERKEAELAID